MKKYFLIAVSILVIAVFISGVQVYAAKKDEQKKDASAVKKGQPVPAKKDQPQKKEPPKADKAAPVVAPVPYKQVTFGAVGLVEYITFNDKEKNITLKDSAGKTTSVLLDNLKKGSRVLLTYRKENDKNVLITLSIITAAETPTVPPSGK